MAEAERVLVIKLGALGDFVLAFAPFAAIRDHHPGAHITLLTTASYADLARQSPWFDAVELDARPGMWNLGGVYRLHRRLRGYDMVYDLQTSGRSSRYFWLAGCPPWSGIGAFRRYPDRDPGRDRLHTRERQRGQLRAAGIGHFAAPDLAWLTDRPTPDLPAPFALLVPGAAAHRPEKRWPAARFAELAQALAAQGIAPIVIGSEAEHAVAAQITAAAPGAIDLVGRTDLPTLAALAARAKWAIGNDTGPMHLAAAVGCRCIVLFGGSSDPGLTAPRGPEGEWPTVLRAADLAGVRVAEVIART